MPKSILEDITIDDEALMDFGIDWVKYELYDIELQSGE